MFKTDICDSMNPTRNKNIMKEGINDSLKVIGRLLQILF